MIDDNPNNVAVISKDGSVKFLNGTAQKVLQKNMCGNVPTNFYKCIYDDHKSKFTSYIKDCFKSAEPITFEIDMKYQIPMQMVQKSTKIGDKKPQSIHSLPQRYHVKVSQSRWESAK